MLLICLKMATWYFCWFHRYFYGCLLDSASCGANFTVFVSDNGIAMTCGDGQQGCLGHGDLHGTTRPRLIESLLPIDVASVACGDSHVVVLGTDGEVMTQNYIISFCLRCWLLWRFFIRLYHRWSKLIAASSIWDRVPDVSYIFFSLTLLCSKNFDIKASEFERREASSNFC